MRINEASQWWKRSSKPVLTSPVELYGSIPTSLPTADEKSEILTVAERLDFLCCWLLAHHTLQIPHARPKQKLSLTVGALLVLGIHRPLA
jgi:hypothetical protein